MRELWRTQVCKWNSFHHGLLRSCRVCGCRLCQLVCDRVPSNPAPSRELRDTSAGTSVLESLIKDSQPEPFSSWQVFVQVGRYPVLARAVYKVYWSMIVVSCWFEQSLHTHSSSSDSFQPLA